MERANSEGGVFAETVQRLKQNEIVGVAIPKLYPNEAAVGEVTTTKCALE
jgi:hypothetical protein